MDKKGKPQNDNKNKLSIEKQSTKGDKSMEMEATKERKRLDFFNEEEIRNISKKLPIRKSKNGVILLDKNNPDDVEWWNED